MKRINIYPIFAQNMLAVLFILFAASTALLIVQQKFSLPPNTASSFGAIVFVFLALSLGDGAWQVKNLLKCYRIWIGIGPSGTSHTRLP